MDCRDLVRKSDERRDVEGVRWVKWEWKWETNSHSHQDHRPTSTCDPFDPFVNRIFSLATRRALTLHVVPFSKRYLSRLSVVVVSLAKESRGSRRGKWMTR